MRLFQPQAARKEASSVPEAGLKGQAPKAAVLLPDRHKYMARLKGQVSSLAGHPRRKAARSTPSSPIRRAAGSNRLARWVKRERPLRKVCPRHQIRMPAGMAAMAALPRRKQMKSPAWHSTGFSKGRLRAGSSKRKKEGCPLKIVADRRKVQLRAARIPGRSSAGNRGKAVCPGFPPSGKRREGKAAGLKGLWRPRVRLKENRISSAGMRPPHGSRVFARSAGRRFVYQHSL